MDVHTPLEWGHKNVDDNRIPSSALKLCIIATTSKDTVISTNLNSSFHVSFLYIIISVANAHRFNKRSHAQTCKHAQTDEQTHLTHTSNDLSFIPFVSDVQLLLPPLPLLYHFCLLTVLTKTENKNYKLALKKSLPPELYHHFGRIVVLLLLH